MKINQKEFHSRKLIYEKAINVNDDLNLNVDEQQDDQKHLKDYMTIRGPLPKIADHDGTIVSFHSTRPQLQPWTRKIYECNKLNEEELIKYI